MIDDFEDGDKDNIISTWMATWDSGSGSTTINTFDLSSPPPSTGNHALELSADMDTDQQLGSGPTYWETSSIITGSTIGATPVDVSNYGKLAFGLSFDGSFNPGMDPNAYPEVEVRVNGSSGSIRYDLLSDFDSQFRDYSLSLSDFAVTSGTLAELKAAVEQVRFQVYIWGDSNDGMTFTLVVDDVRFEE